MRLQTIAQLASEIKKPSKQEAFEILKTLNFNETSLSKLYSFFCDYESAGKNLTDLAWCKKAMDKKNPRYPHLQVTRGYVLGTCGKVMHMVETELEGGWYDHVGQKIANDARLIPENHIKEILEYILISEALEAPLIIDNFLGIDSYVITSNLGVIVSQFKRAMTGFYNPLISFSDIGECLILKEGKRTAVIKCVKLSNNEREETSCHISPQRPLQ